MITQVVVVAIDIIIDTNVTIVTMTVIQRMTKEKEFIKKEKLKESRQKLVTLNRIMKFINKSTCKDWKEN